MDRMQALSCPVLSVLADLFFIFGPFVTHSDLIRIGHVRNISFNKNLHRAFVLPLCRVSVFRAERHVTENE